MKPIYLDYNATTPLDPEVIVAMQLFLTDQFGNPSSTHAYGQATRTAVEQARRQVAELLGATAAEMVFTGGGSEASNQAIKGVAFAGMYGTGPNVCIRPGQRSRWWSWLPRSWRDRHSQVHIITSAVEHPATLQPCAFLKRLGCDVTVLPVDRFAQINLDDLRKALQRPTALVTIMHSNNEVGTLQPIAEIAKLAHQHGALVHTDAAQSVGKLPVNVRELGVDLLSVAGHKLYAPKGIGALFIRTGVTLEPLIHGAGHEQGRRAGTENVPYIVGLGTACAVAGRNLTDTSARLRQLRDRLLQRLQGELNSAISLNGHPTERLPNTLNVNFHGCVGADLLAAIPEIAASTGSACHEGHVQLSPVLQAMGVPPDLGRGAVRLSVGRFTTEEEVDRAVALLIDGARRHGHP